MRVSYASWLQLRWLAPVRGGEEKNEKWTKHAHLIPHPRNHDSSVPHVVLICSCYTCFFPFHVINKFSMNVHTSLTKETDLGVLQTKLFTVFSFLPASCTEMLCSHLSTAKWKGRSEWGVASPANENIWGIKIMSLFAVKLVAGNIRYILTKTFRLRLKTHASHLSH